MIVAPQQLARRWAFLPRFRRLWLETTSVATLHHSAILTGSVSGVTTDAGSSDVDMVGPPDSVSNIRPLRLREPTSEAVSSSSDFQICAINSFEFPLGKGTAKAKSSDVGSETSILDSAQHTVQAGSPNSLNHVVALYLSYSCFVIVGES